MPQRRRGTRLGGQGWSAKVTLRDEEKSAEVMPATWRVGARVGKSRGQHPATKTLNREYFNERMQMLLITFQRENATSVDNPSKGNESNHQIPIHFADSLIPEQAGRGNTEQRQLGSN